MQEEQSTHKAKIATLPPDTGPYHPVNNPDGYLPIPLWVRERL